MEYLFAEEFEFILTSLFQISNKTTFFQYRSMSGGRFLVSLTEVSTSEKKTWYAEPCSKWETIIITGCKKSLNIPARGDYVDAFVQKFELGELVIMETSLCGNSKFVAFITKKFQIENYMILLCSIPMTSHNEHSVCREEVYLDRGSLTWWLANPSDELSNFYVQYLLKLKWLPNKSVFNNMIGVWRVWLLINTLQTPLFACDKHIRCCRKKKQSSS